MKRAMYFVAVIAMVMSAEAWSVNRRGGRAAFVRKDASNNKNNKKKNQLKINIAKKEGASYLIVADTLDYPKRTKNMVGASHQRMADTLEIAEEHAAIGVEISTAAAIEEHQQAKKSSAFDVDGISIEGDNADRPDSEMKKSSLQSTIHQPRSRHTRPLEITVPLIQQRGNMIV